jgi:hypothetical protein
MSSPAQATGERWFIFGCALGTGVPGVVSLVAQRTFGQGVASSRNLTFTTPIAYGCYSATKDQSGLEYGVCAPFFSYGRSHPVYGDRISLFVPFLGSVQMTQVGAIGVTVHLPLFTPFVRLGLTLLVKHPKLAGTCTRTLRGIDELLSSVKSGVQRALAAVTR